MSEQAPNPEQSEETEAHGYRHGPPSQQPAETEAHRKSTVEQDVDDEPDVEAHKKAP
jgi:hypothetical protein